MELHRGVHPRIGVISDAIRTYVHGLVALVRSLEVPLTSQLVIF